MDRGSYKPCKRGRNGRASDVSAAVRPTSLQGHGATPTRPIKRRRRRKRSRMPNPCLSTTCTQTSSTSSLIDDIKKKLVFSTRIRVSDTDLLVSSRLTAVCLSWSEQTQWPWSDDEIKALVSYVRMRGHTERWPGTKSHDFWTSAADFVLQCNPNSNRRSGMLYLAQ